MLETTDKATSDPASDVSIGVTDERARFRKHLKRLTIMVVLIVVGLHLLAGVGAGVLVVARYLIKPAARFTATAPPVDMKPENRKHRLDMDKLASMRPKPSVNNRIQSLKPSALALPSLPKVPVDTTIPLTTDVAAGDFDGFGKPQMGSGSGEGTNPFGSSEAGASGLLEGTLYDFKQTRGRSPTHFEPDKYLAAVAEYAKGKTSVLNRYFAAPVKLYLARLYIPEIKAEEAPAAFKVQDKVQPRMWLAVYQGRVIAPESGTFRFTGGADDILLVWIDGKFVFDGSLKGQTVTEYNGQSEGLPFTVEKGKTYDLRVAVGECPGGVFHAFLRVQKMDGTEPYLFRMTPDPPPKDEKEGPVWVPAPVERKPFGGIGSFGS
jgi:hypothetical protein